jgi:peptidoglycan/xylan/chitin deacetylase (PgdA/CDA1 family)
MNPQPAGVILTYHSISGGASPLCISPSLFAEQVDWLKANARVIPLAELAELIVSGRPLPPRTVVLTFDDGFLDFHSQAAPVLRGAGLPATIFLPTAFCGATNRWPGQPDWAEEQPLMAWEHIRELVGQGFTFGAHSVTHPILTEIPDSAAQQEILSAKQEIERRTGHQVEFFCYPYGRWNAHVRALVGAYYRAACSTRTALLSGQSDLLALPRVDVHLVRQPALFQRLFATWFPAYLSARRTLRSLRGMPESISGN